ncbi:dynamin family protein [Acaryochloris sp. 'Moss Beach']|uniref:dynamin family protein n=1 Tax=Acaryochloris sp. 'Moss Beach' TaxID=2740837 RepID=UPI001F3BDB52|nr:dynamin family protein [Acaryochloris sp. 'Moss Beach']UJB70423.1 dynamin family protein [Acaryochloris sp. 'Moss Beach']
MSTFLDLTQLSATSLAQLDQAQHSRQKVAHHLEAMANTLSTAEIAGATASGPLSLAPQVETLRSVADNLQQGIFRLVVLGDLKRGKSTLLNSLLGERLLPSDVNPCTAVLTVLKYGPQKQVTIHHLDDSPPEQIALEDFKQIYTIDPEEAKALASKDQAAFPNVSHAEIEYPLPLLQQGLELIDTPGLNDTEARNQLVFNFLQDCHAVLFVMDATQPCTLDERRYLQNTLKDRGITIFFLINAWDKVQSNLINPDDSEALASAEDRLRGVFHTHLADYCPHQYDQRVFEVSGLKALRSQLQNDPETLAQSGVPAFLDSLFEFLSQDRIQSELDHALHKAQMTHKQVWAAVSRRLPLLDEDLDLLKEKLVSVQSDFEQLQSIRDDFQTKIRQTRDQESQAIADSFKTYILNLETTFDEDFIAAQPDLEFLEFLDKNNRAVFYTSFKRAFERYMNDRLAAWEFIAKQDISRAFSELNEAADEYRVAYEQVVEVMNDKLLGNRFYAAGHRYDPNEVQLWADILKDVFEAIPGNMNGAVGQFNMFWQSVMQTAVLVIVLQVIGLVFSSLFLNIFAVLLVGTGIFVGQAEYVRQEFLKATRKEFAKYLPQIANDQWEPIHQAVQRCFDTYEIEVIERINQDIVSRQGELNNLVAQKESHSIQVEQESQRLQTLEKSLAEMVQEMERDCQLKD